MIRVEIHETIPAPMEQVFRRLTDIDGYSEWRAGGGGIFVACRQFEPGSVRLGTRYEDRTRLGTVLGEVAEFDPPTRVVFHYSARLFGRTTLEGWPGYTLQARTAAGTLVHHHAEARTYGSMRLLEPLLQRIAARERLRTVQALRRSFQ